MPTLTPEIASGIVSDRPDAASFLKKDGSGHRKYGYRYRFLGSPRREISIASTATKNGITVYINKQACSGENFPVVAPERAFPGVSVTGEYPRGSTGDSGGPGLSTAAASCPSLDPRDNDVLRLSSSETEGFERLIEWYAGDLKLGSMSAPAATGSLTDTGPPPPSALSRPTGETRGLATPIQNAERTQEDAPDDDQGRMLNPRRRAAIERRAVDMAITWYQGQAYKVEELGKPFDLLCIPASDCAEGTRTVHVEVKGSIGPALRVHVTSNEVADARAAGPSWRSDLFIVSGIELNEASDGSIAALGGVPRVIEGWCPAEGDLRATDYVYDVPLSAPATAQ
jgi:hypothetical protein